MLKIITLVVIAGVAIGIVGGVVEGSSSLYIGALIAVIGISALYAYAIWKNPIGVVKPEADVTTQAEGMPPAALVETPLSERPVATLVIETPIGETGRNLQKQLPSVER